MHAPYLGDCKEDQTVAFKFNTDSGGTPITLAGTPLVRVYKRGSTSESSAGIALTVDYDSVTGLHDVVIDLSADAFYAVGYDYTVVLTQGTVDDVSIAGTVLATFSIESRFKQFLDIMEGTTNYKQAMQAIFAFASGITNGGGTATINFRDKANSKNRMIMTVDENGNRSVVTFSFDA